MRSVSGYRFALGLLQGGALSLLYLAYEERSWPATNGALFAPLLLVALLVPLLVIQSLRSLRLRTLIGWTVVATAAIAALAYYDIWRAWPQDWVIDRTAPLGAWQAHILPSWPFIVALPAILFIAHALIVSADADSRPIANYSIYFEVAWEQGIQLALTAIFVGVFWALMWLGAGLFELLKSISWRGSSAIIGSGYRRRHSPSQSPFMRPTRASAWCAARGCWRSPCCRCCCRC